MIQLNRILTSGFMRWDDLIAIGNIVGTEPRTVTTAIAVRPEDRADVLIVDGRRSDKRVDDYITATRSHLITIHEDVDVDPTIKAKVYDASAVPDLSDILMNVAKFDTKFADAEAILDNLNKYGLMDTDFAFTFVPKATLDPTMLLANAQNIAAKLVPLRRVGLPYNSDGMIRIRDVQHLLNQLGYFGVDPADANTLKFVRRFLVPSEHEGGSILFEEAIIGEDALKFLTHSIVCIKPALTHLEFHSLDERTLAYYGINLIPFYLSLSLPDSELEVFRGLQDGYTLDIYSKLFSKVNIDPILSGHTETLA
jgi:hypothetical protein